MARMGRIKPFRRPVLTCADVCGVLFLFLPSGSGGGDCVFSQPFSLNVRTGLISPPRLVRANFPVYSCSTQNPAE